MESSTEAAKTADTTKTTLEVEDKHEENKDSVVSHYTLTSSNADVLT